MQFDQKRRAFITLLGAAAAWPIAARAQQRERVRRVGVITNALADDPAAQSRLTAFVQGLQQLGWSDSRNVRIDTRWGAGDTERVRRYAAELVALAPDVILTVGSPTTGPLLQATRNIPIVILSAYASQQHIDQLLATGAAASLTKPIRVRDLLQVLDGILGEAVADAVHAVPAADAAAGHHGTPGTDRAPGGQEAP